MISILVVAIVCLFLLLFCFFPILHLLGWFLIGVIAGFLAKLFMPDIPKLVFWQTLLLGVAGSLMGGAVSQLLGVHFGLLGSIGMSVILIGVWAWANQSDDLNDE